jgi:nucleoside phosphorylase
MSAATAPVVDFLILAPLKEEREAVLAQLGSAHRLPPDEQDVRVYYQADVATTLAGGTAGSYRVIVTSPLGLGRVEAATVTADAIRRFQPRYVLLVGIAGGAPEEVALGDVLLAEQFVDYEQQTLAADGARLRYQTFRADPRLYGAAQHLSRWEAAVRATRPTEGSPSVHTGIVISGDKVQAKAAALAPYKADWPKLIGVEMEAAGVAAAAWEAASKPGVLMVRGVSDLADSEKGSARVKTWRPYACDVAAAFAISLLRDGPVPLRAAGPATVATPSAPPASAAIDDDLDSQKARGTVGPQPTRASLRKVLQEVLRIDSDLDAFCLDYFPQVKRLFSGGMDTEQKRSLLLQREDAAQIWKHLQEAEPKACAKYAHLIALAR